MGYTGIIRRVDDLGRIVVPIEMRRHLRIETGDEIEMQVEDNRVVITRYAANCVICNGDHDTLDISGVPVCAPCARLVLDRFGQAGAL